MVILSESVCLHYVNEVDILHDFVNVNYCMTSTVKQETSEVVCGGAAGPSLIPI